MSRATKAVAEYAWLHARCNLVLLALGRAGVIRDVRTWDIHDIGTEIGNSGITVTISIESYRCGDRDTTIIDVPLALIDDEDADLAEFAAGKARELAAAHEHAAKVRADQQLQTARLQLTKLLEQHPSLIADLTKGFQP